ncbi:MAG TPA: LuxR C-terminal-related transcriptional regulator [Bauldia sp.]|nr:LuxR C-terminal-related transcriptional regulator [Bauldia sp.]
MEGLASEDYRKVLAAIEILGRDVDQATFPERALDAIAAAIDVDMVSYNEIDLSTGGNRFLLKPNIAELGPDDPRYPRFVRRFGNHPILAHQLSRQPRMRPDLGQFLERIRMLGMVGNCCGDAELRLNLGLTVEDAATRRIGISLNRGVRDFDPNDAARLEVLRPHIVAAYRNALTVAARTRVTAASASAIRVDGLPLTRRENEVLYWVSMGKTNEEVSAIIGAKPMTVKKHLEHIYDKLGVPNRTAAARLRVSPPD